MEKYFIAFGCLMSISFLNAQMIRYAFRLRNFTIETETNGIYLINMTILQYGAEHRFNADANITNDVRVQAIQVVIHRCAFEKSACEYFQTWKVKDNLKSFAFMKNQLWTPIFTAVTPKIDLPFLRKNIYSVRNATMNPDAAVLFYPEITKYFWRAYVYIIDTKDKNAIVLVFDFSIFEYVQRSRKRKPPNMRV